MKMIMITTGIELLIIHGLRKIGVIILWDVGIGLIKIVIVFKVIGHDMYA